MPTRQQTPRQIPQSTIPNWRDQYGALVYTAAEDAWRWQRQNPGRRCYLYFSPAEGMTWGKFYVVPEGEEGQQPPGTIPARPETIPADTLPKITAWIQQVSDRLPLIGENRCRWQIGRMYPRRCTLPESHTGDCAWEKKLA